jgi:hypothetical protein
VNERERRQERFAKNEALFREVNERIKQLTKQWIATDELIEFTCECANPACTDRIHVSLEDYESARARPNRFLVVPGHLDLEVEDVVAERDAFWLVDKRGQAGQTAAELDPRR